MTYRRIIFCGLAMLAAAFIYAAQSSAEYHRTDPGVYNVTFADFDYVAPKAMYVDAERLAVVTDRDAVKPVKHRSISILHPVYQLSLATDAQNFIDLRMRC